MRVDQYSVGHVSEDMQKLADRIGESCRVFRDMGSTEDERLRNLYDMQAFADELSELCAGMGKYLRRLG